MTTWKKTPAGKAIAKLDMNTRAIAKLVSAEACVFDDETWSAADQTRAIGVLGELKFALIQERRNLRVTLEDELKRQREYRRDV
jgi:hypothetical protein